MSVSVLLEVNAKPEKIEELISTLEHILPDTRRFDGCINVKVTENQDNKLNLVIQETWNSRQHYEKYMAWRTETGAIKALVSMLSESPSIRYFDGLDI